MRKAAIYMLVVLVMALVSDIEAQGQHGNKQEQIKAIKTAFITEKLDLSPEEAEKFWPIYNEFKDKERNIQQDVAFHFRQGPPDISGMTDQEIEKMILGRFEQEHALVELRKEYYVKLKEVIPVPKIFKLLEAEVQFRKVMLERLRDQRKRNHQ